MITILKIAVRNVVRNGRRSAMTVAAIAMGVMAIAIFGAFMQYVILSYQTSTVERVGHIILYKSGYSRFGSANPVAYALDNYAAIADAIKADPELRRLAAVVTETQVVSGIASNYDAEASKTFFGEGAVPRDRAIMQRWNGYNIADFVGRRSALADDSPDTGVVGVGLARTLGLCDALKIRSCMGLKPSTAITGKSDNPMKSDLDLPGLPAPMAVPKSAVPRVDLLAATASGAPNVVSLTLARAEFQGVKEVDDSYVAMPLALAQKLVYGRAEPKVTSIVLQLHRTADIPLAKARLQHLIIRNDWPLEVREFSELAAFYQQTSSFLGTIFAFVSAIIGTIVIFTVVNTLSMNVMERTAEIGTVRALGAQRNALRLQFLVEGLTLGLLGATIGLGGAALIAFAVDHAGITWTPPGTARPAPLNLYFFEFGALIIGSWAGMLVVATLGGIAPANRAARMVIVEALRHA